MKSFVPAVGVAVVLVGVSILAVPAVASGAEYLNETRTATTTNRLNASSDGVAGAPAAVDLTPLITAWGATGLALLAGGSIAVATSVRRQRHAAV